MNIYEQYLISCKRMKKALKDKGVKGIRKNIDKMTRSELLNFRDKLYDLVKEWEEQNNEYLDF